jgi:hypothetical protein
MVYDLVRILLLYFLKSILGDKYFIKLFEIPKLIGFF